MIDYKTAPREGDPSEFSEGLQAPLYAACALARNGGEACLAGYHYLRHGTTRWQQVTREDGGQLASRFLARVRETQAAQELPANPGILCAWCGFNRICPEAQVPAQLLARPAKAHLLQPLPGDGHVHLRFSRRLPRATSARAA